MPRLPTIRVIGSQDISTSFRSLTGASRAGAVAVAMLFLLSLVARAVGVGVVSGGELGAAVPPLRLLIDRGVGETPQVADELPVEAGELGRDHAAGRLVHEGHELVGEAGHGAGDADPADVGAAADARHPAALGDVAVDDGPPAADPYQALGRAVLVGEVALLVVAAAVAPLVDRLAEEPGRPQLLVQRDH